MSEDNKKLIPSVGQDPNFLQALSQQIKLILRLMADSRVNPMLKALPIAALAYLIWPFDLLPFLPIDDAIVIGIGFYTFVEWCPEDVVAEHKDKLSAESSSGGNSTKDS